MNDQTDAQLVAAIVAGDRNAFAALYDRYADPLYDVARSMLRDPHDAADAVQDVFVIASQRLDQLRDPARVRAWLFSVLRHDVYRRSAKRRRTTPTDSFADTPAPVMAEHEGGRLELAELARLVRDAAEGLDDRDRLVLELSVRQGLQGADLASALGVSADQSYSIVFRMRARAERALGALVVARSNRASCAALDHLLRDWDGRFSVLVRKRVARHIEQCDVCESHRKKVGTVAAFAAAPAWAAPLALRERVLAGFGSGPAPDDPSIDDAPGPRGDRVRASELSWAPDGFPGVARVVRRGAAALVLGALVVLAIGALGVAGALSGGGGEPSTLVAGAVESRPEATNATGPAGSRSPAPAPASTEPTTVTAASAVAPGVAAPTTGAPSDPTTTPPPAAVPPAPPGGPSTTAPGPTVTTVTTVTTVSPPPTTTPGTPAPTTTARPPVTNPPTTTTTVARVARLVVSPARVDTGATARTASFVVRNDGDAPLSWSATLASGPLSQVSPTGGILDPGGSTPVTVVVDRANAPEGAFEGRVDVGGNGGAASVVVAGRTERGPSISLTTSPASFPTLYTPAAGCTPVSASISAAVTDESAIASVSLHWRGPGGAPGSSVPMGLRAGRWVATLGSFATGGGLEWWVRAEDVRGNVTTTPSRSATVALACIR